MKAVAQSHVWWPDIDKAIEECSKACSACQSNKNLAPLHPWVWPGPCGLCWTFLGEDVFVAPLEVAGGHYYDKYYDHQNY